MNNPRKAGMRVTFDSNVWEKIFDNKIKSDVPAKLRKHSIAGFICESAFRIEAIEREKRVDYFREPKIEAALFPAMTAPAGMTPFLSIGPRDSAHPGIPTTQMVKLRTAATFGVKLLRGCNWIGLPNPRGLTQTLSYVDETIDERKERENRQYEVFFAIQKRGVGKAAFEAAGGWCVEKLIKTNPKRFQKACAEWADAELVAAHIGYRNDVLCTFDEAGEGKKRRARKSIFSTENRQWLIEKYGVIIKTPEELFQIL
jgi:hypothetical protein